MVPCDVRPFSATAPHPLSYRDTHASGKNSSFAPPAQDKTTVEQRAWHNILHNVSVFEAGQAGSRRSRTSETTTSFTHLRWAGRLVLPGRQSSTSKSGKHFDACTVAQTPEKLFTIFPR